MATDRGPTCTCPLPDTPEEAGERGLGANQILVERQTRVCLRVTVMDLWGKEMVEEGQEGGEVRGREEGGRREGGRQAVRSTQDAVSCSPWRLGTQFCPTDSILLAFTFRNTSRYIF